MKQRGVIIIKKILIISGSPRKNKNSSYISNLIFEELKTFNIEVKQIYLSNLNINHCIACEYCSKTGKCVFNDDMSKLYSEFDSSDGTIFISPVYFNSITSISKTMIDRCQMLWASKYQYHTPSIDRKKHRDGLFISIGGSKTYKNQFLASQIVVDMFFKAINTKYKSDILINDTDNLNVWDNKELILKIKNSVRGIFID